MAFNRETYQARRYAEDAKHAMADARRFKAEGRIDISAASAKMACAFHRLAMNYRRRKALAVHGGARS